MNKKPYILVTPGFLRPMRSFESVNIRISVRNGEQDEVVEVELSGIIGGINSLLSKKKQVQCTDRDRSDSPSTLIQINALRGGEPKLIISSPTDRFAKASIVSDPRALIMLPPSPEDITLDQEADEEVSTEDIEDDTSSTPARYIMAVASRDVVLAHENPDDVNTDPGVEPKSVKRFQRDLLLMQNQSRRRVRPMHIALGFLLLFMPFHVVPLAQTKNQDTPPVTDTAEQLPESLLPESEVVEETSPSEPTNCSFWSPSMLSPLARSKQEETLGQYVVKCDDNNFYTAESSRKVNDTWIHTGLNSYTK